MIRVFRFSLLLLLILLAPLSARGQEPDPGDERVPGESMRVTLLTIGQGELIWERFGHNALLFEDEETGWNATYHWGVFNFHQVDFVPRLIRGTMLYGMGKTDLGAMLNGYRGAGRPVWAQELTLTPAQKRRLLSRVEENYRPENREYRYDYYLDNCSTRLRDHLDVVLGGGLTALFAADTTPHTFRWHTRRVLRDLPPYYLGIQTVLGPSADRPITVWEEMFLPSTLMDRIGEVQVPGGAGEIRSLVSRERVLLDPGRGGPPSAPPLAFPVFLLVGVAWGGGLLRLVGSGVDLGGGKRFAVAALGGGWGLLAGLTGILLLGAWMYTDHTFWYANYNLFQVNPLFLGVPVAFLFFSVSGRFPRWGRLLATALGAMSVLGVLLEILPGLGQSNLEFLALAVPINLALWAVARRLDEGSGTGPP